MKMSVANFKIGFIHLIKKQMKNLHFQCRLFWIANCGPHGQIPGWVLVVLTSAYQNYLVNQFHAFIINLNNRRIYVL